MRYPNKKTNNSDVLEPHFEEMDRRVKHFQAHGRTEKARNIAALSVLEAPEISSKELAQLRVDLDVSQAVFAKYLGVSIAAVKAWEGQGRNNCPGPVRRIVQLISESRRGKRDLFDRYIEEIR